MVHETLDGLRLGVCLLQPPLIDACDRHSSRVALGLDREDAAGPNHDVVHVAAPKVGVMDGEPACGAQVVENRTDMLLAVSAAIPSIDDRQRKAVEREEPGDCGDLRDGERKPVESEQESDRCPYGDERDNRREHTGREAASHLPSMLTGATCGHAQSVGRKGGSLDGPRGSLAGYLASARWEQTLRITGGRRPQGTRAVPRSAEPCSSVPPDTEDGSCHHAGISRRSRTRRAAKDCHGKEGVDGSSPSEGFGGTGCYRPPFAVAPSASSSFRPPAGYPVGTTPSRTASRASRITSTAGRLWAGWNSSKRRP